MSAVEEQQTQAALAEATAAEPATAADKAKKKKKKNKKKKKKALRGVAIVSEEDRVACGQTSPPTIQVCELPAFAPLPEGEGDAEKGTDICTFPAGEFTEYHQVWNSKRISDAELRALERQDSGRIAALREAAEVHRQVRMDTQRHIKPGMPLMEVARRLESLLKKLVGFDPKDPLHRSQAFPTGLSVNHVAAHWTPNAGDKTVLQQGDIISIDFGAQIDGHMTDSAFTVAFDAKHDGIMAAVKAATETGVREAGIDVRLGDIGAAIQEVMESHEVEYDGRTYQVKCVRNLNGHSIERYRIHAGKSVPIVDNGDSTKMEEGEYYAIETFGSTGNGHVVEDTDCSHYAVDFDAFQHAAAGQLPMPSRRAGQLFRVIENRFGSLPWARRWLHDEQLFDKFALPLKQLVDAGIVTDYPPLVDRVGCYTAQYEHNIILHPSRKEILTRGLDY
ncbi:MAG: hypothetical protein MHM6MM_007100 [Cercozoa sp. M6MM]